MSLVRELSRICVVEKQQALPYNDMFVPRCHYVNADIGVLHAVIADTHENKLNKDTPITWRRYWSMRLLLIFVYVWAMYRYDA